MGAWGAGLYQDDIAADIKEEWKVLSQFGFNSPDIKKRIRETYLQFDINDSDTYIPSWLVVADILIKKKNLDEETKKLALEIIDKELDLNSWKQHGASDSDIKKREKVLARLREKIISSEYVNPKKSKVHVEKTDLDAVSYTHLTLPTILLV